MFIENQEAFANKLKNLRTVSRLSQIKLAKELNISRSCLANYESGKRFPSADILEIISKYFKVSVDYLLESSGSVFLKRDKNHEMSELIKEVSASGKLDVSNISPLSKVALFEFYDFLKGKESHPIKIKNA